MSLEVDKDERFKVVISGFKTEQQALKFVQAYSGGVEQRMDDWINSTLGDFNACTKIYTDKPDSEGNFYLELYGEMD